MFFFFKVQNTDNEDEVVVGESFKEDVNSNTEHKKLFYTSMYQKKKNTF